MITAQNKKYVLLQFTLIQTHVMDWAEVQREDPVLSAVLDWLKAQKRTDLKASSGEASLQQRRPNDPMEMTRFCGPSGSLIPALNAQGKAKNLLLFVVPKAHCIATLNGYHRDAGHQGCDHILSLLMEHFWWTGMVNQIWKSIKNSICCLQHEGKLPKVPLYPFVATTPLDLLHVDFTSTEMTMELNQPPRVTNVLVFQDHLTKHIMVYVTPNQTAKIVAKFLYQGYISIFRALARLLSDWGANFMSSIIDKLCALLSMRKLQTMLYNPQMNELVERSHQTIKQMIGKLGKDKRADWPGHLAEIVQAYKATQSSVMRYSPHYLMFGCRPRLSVDFYFPTFRNAEAPLRGASAKCVDEYVATLCDQLRVALWEAQAQSMAKAQFQKWYYD